MNFIKILLLCYLLISFTTDEKNSVPQHSSNTPIETEWIVSNFAQSPSENIQLLGAPKTVNCIYGNALEFNGLNDGIFIKSMPLNNLTEFTIEAIFRPDSGGNFEQRFFHCGTITGSRVLLEIRATKTGWYFDGFAKSEEQACTLIDSTLLHPLDKWYHVAYTVDNGKLTTYVNGEKELNGKIDFIPLSKGKTSVGVRQNELSWFKGAIYAIKITPRILQPKEFMKE